MAKNQSEVWPLAVYTEGTVFSDKFSVGTQTMVHAFLRVTAVTGGGNVVAWLQASHDGANWFDVASDQQLTLDSGTANQVERNGDRNINGNVALSAAGSCIATYKHFPAPWCRVARGIQGGTTPTATLALHVAGA